MKRLLTVSAVLAAILLPPVVERGSVGACTPPPCVATGPIVCNVQSSSVDFSMQPQSAQMSVAFHNVTSQGCMTMPITMSVMVSQMDGFQDLAISMVDLPPMPFTVGVDEAVSGTISVDIPGGALVGTRTLMVEVMGTTTPRACMVELEINGNIKVNDMSENTCALAGTPIEKMFQLTNNTGIPRTVDYVITSRQNASTPGDGDHFPIASCADPLPAGSPLDPTPPEVLGTVMLPAMGTADVCIRTRSFPLCHPGSNCGYLIVATDRLSGQLAAAGSDYTVVSPIWGGCAGCIQGIVCGDGNADGSVDIIDALVAAQIAVGFSMSTDAQGCWLDVTSDAVINILDALTVAQFAIGLPTVLNCPMVPQVP